MGHNDHFGEHRLHASCPACGRAFEYTEEDQVPGFRVRDSLLCPYCGHELDASMEVEFRSYKTLESD